MWHSRPSARALRRVFLDLEKGSNWKAWGVSNFLEGDLFAWYISAWTDEVAAALRAMAQKADEYDPSTLSVDPGESHDLLKVLYQNLIPQKIRHDLGEYYTPDWLASHVLDLVSYDGNPDTRILDPGCGSGTSLVEAINRLPRPCNLRRWTFPKPKGGRAGAPAAEMPNALSPCAAEFRRSRPGTAFIRGDTGGMAGSGFPGLAEDCLSAT